MLSFSNLEYFLQGQVHIRFAGALPQFVEALLTARLQSELQRSSLGKVSDRQIEGDLKTEPATNGDGKMEKRRSPGDASSFVPSQP